MTGRLATHLGNTTVKIQIIWTRLSSNLIGSKSLNESADNEYSPHQQNASKFFLLDRSCSWTEELENVSHLF